MFSFIYIRANEMIIANFHVYESNDSLPSTWWPLLRTTERGCGVLDVAGLLATDFKITFAGVPLTCWRTTTGAFGGGVATALSESLCCVLETFETIFGSSDFTMSFRSGRFAAAVVTIRKPVGDSISFWPGWSPVTLVIFPSWLRIIPSFWRWLGACCGRDCCFKLD